MIDSMLAAGRPPPTEEGRLEVDVVDFAVLIWT
jgi:hypothetical protein